MVADIGRQGLDVDQIEAAIAVISMFNYFTRVADATGIEFDYQTPLPAFEPDLRQVSAPRPVRQASYPVLARGDDPPEPPATADRARPRHPPLRAAWESWRAYVLEADEPPSRRERQLAARVAAEETADWEEAEILGQVRSEGSGDRELVEFAGKLSREPWCMAPGDLDKLRGAGHSEVAILHVISVVAHQNADSRLAIGLGAAARA